MPRPRTRKNHPFIQRLLNIHSTDLMGLSHMTGVSHSTWRSWADMRADNQNWITVKKAAEGLGLSVDEFIEGMLAET